MTEGSLSVGEWRLLIAVIGIVILAAIYWIGTAKRPDQGRRTPSRGRSDRREPVVTSDDDPTLDVASFNALDSDDGVAAEPVQGELDVGDPPITLPPAPNAVAAKPQPIQNGPLPGHRAPDLPVERIVSVFVVADGDDGFHGPDIIVGAEKTGLEFGDMNIFHRTVEQGGDAGPVFSVANMVKPGSFDMGGIDHLQTPGLTLFMTLPGPLPALDAWDTMLPTAQRLAELLGGQVVDEAHNALGRQRIAYIRDDLRAWDRKHEGDSISIDPR